ncbi:hypothetical protein [Microvirga pakistanensis]|uniref:hypothetical protein n=1 Tax=Microvirga pakistanensis TaxID=1682650 RepID=UPI00141A9289|nr:hypothetical protein [Microvirga pakistanensis]
MWSLQRLDAQRKDAELPPLDEALAEEVVTLLSDLEEAFKRLPAVALADPTKELCDE